MNYFHSWTLHCFNSLLDGAWQPYNFCEWLVKQLPSDGREMRRKQKVSIFMLLLFMVFVRQLFDESFINALVGASETLSILYSFSLETQSVFSILLQNTSMQRKCVSVLNYVELNSLFYKYFRRVSHCSKSSFLLQSTTTTTTKKYWKSLHKICELNLLVNFTCEIYFEILKWTDEMKLIISVHNLVYSLRGIFRFIKLMAEKNDTEMDVNKFKQFNRQWV